ncbi:alkaline phosphatase family protein [Evansella cellulosilytica]|uniref:Type I phosphodiesterase/nucleotide pyrophosphatase n=1 Tax=Evansella cellulosilytica (strain ATCC 21833 / DSM 2522 / FERM P-1141 / JCM 9156 / N-4) TaxID=649639 RepID=E6TU07_EVAC2|nr:ectonucleotide pyrophosphatase/phosphodiesterase [Evansella cellulosilytica]ADU32038.1 type I phosphodiesterase/nucleotide pyrophosphatase [Evansella cellulosilytica DSM 2522]
MRAQRENNIVIVSIDGMAQFYLDEGKVDLPNIQALIEKGTVAKGMKSIFPTATWAIHTSLVTGCYPKKHGVLGNWVIDRTVPRVGEHFGDKTWTKEESVLKKTFYDVAKEKDWTTASICWPKTKLAPTIDHNIPEFYEQELFELFSSEQLWKELKAKQLPVENYGVWSKDHSRGHMQDALTTDIAKHLIEEHQPNLMMLHYLLPDSYQHDYGTRSKEVYWSLQFIDEQIGKVIDALKEKGLWDRTNMFVVSDHGFVDTSWSFYPNILFYQKGWFDPSDFRTKTKVAAVSNGGSGYVYVKETDEVKKQKLIKEVHALLAATEHVKAVYELEQFGVLGLPVENELDDHRPDLVFEMEKDCFIHYGFEGEEVIQKQAKFKGMHGYSPDLEEMKAVFIASGPAIKEGHVIEEVRAIDLAPTITRLIGEKLHDIDGTEVEGIWKEELTVGDYNNGYVKTK